MIQRSTMTTVLTSTMCCLCCLGIFMLGCYFGMEMGCDHSPAPMTSTNGAQVLRPTASDATHVATHLVATDASHETKPRSTNTTSVETPAELASTTKAAYETLFTVPAATDTTHTATPTTVAAVITATHEATPAIHIASTTATTAHATVTEAYVTPTTDRTIRHESESHGLKHNSSTQPWTSNLI